MLSCESAVDNKLRILVVHGWTSFLKIALFFWSYDERTSARGTLFMTVFVLPDMGAFARASKKSQVTCGNTTIARQSAALSALNPFSIPGLPGAPLRSTPGFYLSCLWASGSQDAKPATRILQPAPKAHQDNRLKLQGPGSF